MVGAHQNLNGSLDLTMPHVGWFVIHRVGLATINLSNLKSLSPPQRKYEKGYKIFLKWGDLGLLGVTQGH